MRHFASRAFWEAYEKRPEQIRVLADKNYALPKAIPGIRRSNSRRSDASGRFG
jgi:hypothetical protein